MHRFKIDIKDINDSDVVITGSQANHLKRVVRLEVGDEVAVFDGEGAEYRAVIREFLPEAVRCEIINRLDVHTEAPVRVVLIQGLPKGDKLEHVIQKGTELGVSGVIPVVTSRTVVRLEPERQERKLDRWRIIAAEAARQCRRAVIPFIGPVKTWEEAVRSAAEGEMAGSPGIAGGRSGLILPWEGETNTGLKTVLQQHRSSGAASGTLYILIGPEGGLASEEVRFAVEYGAIPVSLGPRILRTETAGLAVLAAVMYELGDLGGSVSSD